MGSALGTDTDIETNSESEKNEGVRGTEKQCTNQFEDKSDKFSVSFDVGNISPEEVTVRIKEGTLSVSGQHVQNKGKGFSFQGFSEEFAIPPTVDAKTLIATIVDGQRMQIEGNYLSPPLNTTTGHKTLNHIGKDGAKIPKGKKRNLATPDREVSAFQSPDRKRICTAISECPGSKRIIPDTTVIKSLEFNVEVIKEKGSPDHVSSEFETKRDGDVMMSN
ncbi:hypothetical protein scyTo_0003310 [Scyliorhinus torazame]|uniref:SHSP domain-containing protein n=1 Tax=Scyliorhinus torazame TaxID=75743 RepID=A0A401PM50_SCYTO|nr:hypothetical protein [Scyliorhinus torazame]